MDCCIIKLPHLRALILRIPCMTGITEGENPLLRSGFLFVSSSATESCCKTIFIKCLLQSLRLHNICVRRTMVKWINPFLTPSSLIYSIISSPYFSAVLSLNSIISLNFHVVFTCKMETVAFLDKKPLMLNEALQKNLYQ